MIVFDLVCSPEAHQFEGWFGSSSDFEEQNSKQMIACPTCGSVAIRKALMAPNVSAKSNKSTNQSVRRSGGEPKQAKPAPESKDLEPIGNSVQVPPEYRELIEKLSEAQDKVLEKSEWVGKEFPEKARAIHYGEVEDKMIHGTASKEDAEELSDEGIDIAALPLPYVPPKSQN